jgi:hypothetical protein
MEKIDILFLGFGATFLTFLASSDFTEYICSYKAQYYLIIKYKHSVRGAETTS